MSLLQNRLLLFLVVFSAIMSIALPSFSYDFYVTKTEDTNDGSCDNDCSLREAIIAANNLFDVDSRIIHVPAGYYFITLEGYDDEAATGDLDITNSMTIIGEGMHATIVQAFGSWGVHDRVFHVNAPESEVGFENLNISGGYNDTGGGGGVLITDAREVYFYQCDLYGNLAAYGGAIYFGDNNFNSTNNNLTIRESLIKGNMANFAGGIYASHIGLTIDRSTITENSASLVAGGLYGDSVASEILNSTFYKNIASSASEMWLVQNSVLAFSHSTLVSSDSNIETVDIAYSESNALPLFFINSIVWGRCWPEASGLNATYGRNMGEPMNSCGFGESDIILESDPILLPLGDYGGPTPTAPPAIGSLAIDNGVYVGGTTAFSNPTIDQRGIARPQSGDGNATEEWDIGSVERESFTNLFKRISSDLKYMVKDPSIPSGIQKSLAYKVANSDKSYDKGNFRAAINQLEALKNSVEAQREKALTDTQADNIIFLSNEAIVVLENED